MIRRANLVRGLKGAARRPLRSDIPAFTPRYHVSTAPSPRALAVAGGLVVAALAVASFAITTLLAPSPAAPSPVPGISETVSRPFSPSPNPPMAQHAPLPPAVSDANETRPVPKYLQRHSVSLKGASLSDAVRLVGAMTGIQVEIAPGLPDPVVNLDYHDRTGLEILQDLGRQYAFTPFEQESGHVLVIPAVDDGATIGSDSTSTPHRPLSP